MTDIRNIEQAKPKEQEQDSSSKLLEDSGLLTPENKSQEKNASNIAKPRVNGEIIPDQYIVTLKQKGLGSGPLSPHAPDIVGQVMSRVGLIPRTTPDIQTYRNAFSGFAAKLSPQQLAQLQNDPDVAAIEPDRKIFLEPRSEGTRTLTPAKEVPNGISRIDGRLSQTAKTPGGVDVDIAVIDTGINMKHSDLNVVSNVSFVDGTSTGDDDNGHGSHVAGTIAAKDDGKGVTGVAPGARLWAVKVLDGDGSGTLSGVAAGIDYVAKNADKIEVANMSLGGRLKSDVIDKALDGAVDAGVSFAVAAGNSGADAKDFTPANHPKVLAVSAVADSDGIGGGKGGSVDWEKDDVLASFSNYGDVVRIAAPGVGIESTWKADGTNTDTFNSISGTSMASPHVAGALGLVKARNPGMKPADVYKTVIDAAKAQDDPDYGFKGDKNNVKEPMLNVAKF